MVSAIITCAGTGSRAGFGYNKLLKDIGGITPFEKTVCAFANTGLADEIIIVCSPEDEEIFKKKCAYRSINARFVPGSTTRFKSVLNGLDAAKGDVVLIHDGARPFVSERIIKDCVDSVKKFGTGVTAVSATDTICDTEEKDGERFIVSSSRKGKFLVQTPQGFKTEELKKAFSLVRENEEFTDESGIYTKYIGKCRIVNGDIANKKLTYAEDFAVYENAGGKIFAGTGFDLHLLVEGRKLILGGIEIPHTKGLLGHSDADVLTHAIMDAMLSSASLGDIGRHFPDTDPKYKGISSMLLLKEVLSRLEKRGYVVKFVSATIACQRPKLNPYFDKIRTSLSHALSICKDNLSLAFTTTEGLGLVGAGDGIAVIASATVGAKQ